jgi:hypothetical protein
VPVDAIGRHLVCPVYILSTEGINQALKLFAFPPIIVYFLLLVKVSSKVDHSPGIFQNTGFSSILIDSRPHPVIG